MAVAIFGCRANDAPKTQPATVKAADASPMPDTTPLPLGYAEHEREVRTKIEASKQGN